MVVGGTLLYKWEHKSCELLSEKRTQNTEYSKITDAEIEVFFVCLVGTYPLISEI